VSVFARVYVCVCVCMCVCVSVCECVCVCSGLMLCLSSGDTLQLLLITAIMHASTERGPLMLDAWHGHTTLAPITPW